VNSLSGIAGATLPHQFTGAAWTKFTVPLVIAFTLGGVVSTIAADSPNVSTNAVPENAIRAVNDSALTLSTNRYRREFKGNPPQSPVGFTPDSGVPPYDQPVPTDIPQDLHPRMVRTNSPSHVLPPAQFNPDPGAVNVAPAAQRPFYTNEIQLLPDYNGQPIDPRFALPRSPLMRRDIEIPSPTNGVPYGFDPLEGEYKLPRTNTFENAPINKKYEYPQYELSAKGMGFPTNTVPEPNRWRVGFAPWQRYTSGDTETPYEAPATMLWHPYQQSLLKGDSPIIGQDIFLDLTAETETDFEGRRVPTPSGLDASRAGSAEVFGQSEEISVINNFSFSIDIFKGDTAFQPVHWLIHLQPVYNINYIQANETGVVAADPRGVGPNHNVPPPSNIGITNPSQIPGFLNGQLSTGPVNQTGTSSTQRTKEFLSLQEAFFEYHISDLSDNYDFIASRFGNQVFNNDFRGFLFNDINTGARIFGNWDNNHYQYNVAAFDMREKDTDSGLNTFNSRDQRILLANVYRQDFIWHGYTAQGSILANFDNGPTHYDENGNLVRPEPIGTIQQHSLHAYYLGWAGDGHIGRFNISHQFYQALGHDDFNQLAGHPVNINAQMAAVELSYDRDWIRYKSSVFYASGDHNTSGGTATGFDTVMDNPNFTGGPFSYWVRQGFNLGGTAVNLKQPNSLVPDIRSSKTQGQANFVNPGVLMLSLGTEMDITPKLRTFFNVNYIRFMETDPIKEALLTDTVAHEVGWDLSVGLQYRPLLTDNIIISAGFGTLIPGAGYKDIYRTVTTPVPGYNPPENAGHADDFLYSGILAVTFTY
jgi:hypothetical protein